MSHLHAEADAKEGSVLLDVGRQRLRETLSVQSFHCAPE